VIPSYAGAVIWEALGCPDCGRMMSRGLAYARGNVSCPCGRIYHVPTQFRSAIGHLSLGEEPLIAAESCVDQPLPAIANEALDAMEQDGWTPQQVRALITDYRKLAGY
jgi:hypothetical protein